MNLGRILRIVRGDLDDEVGGDSQRNWKDWQLVEYINRGVREICKELYPLRSDDLIAETVATGSITLSGSAGQIDSVKVNGVTITSAAVAFDASLTTTAADLAANINAYAVNPANTNPIKFTAAASLGVVTITSPAGTGTTPNGYSIVAASSGGMSAVSVAMSGGSCLCRLFLIPGQTVYSLDKKVIKIMRFKPESQPNPVYPTTKAYLDRSRGDWQNMSAGFAITYVPDYFNKKITVVPAPLTADTVDLDIARFPIKEFSTGLDDSTVIDLKAEPEFGEEYHDPIIPWVKREAFLKVDRETLNMNKSNKYEVEFYRQIEQIKAKLQIPEEVQTTGFAPLGMY